MSTNGRHRPLVGTMPLARRSFLFVLALALGSLIGPTRALGVSREEILEALRVDRVQADYVVLVDTSASMDEGGRYERVREELRTFLGAAGPNDHVSVITFDVTPAIRFSGDAEDARSATDRLPDVPKGRYTDIGAAIQAAIDELKRPDAAPVATVVMLTDGRHEPPPGSACPSTRGEGWDALRERSRELRTGVIRTYALGLDEATDARLLKSVFPDASIVALPSDQLASYLDRVKEESRMAKAQRVLGPDAESEVRAEWSVPTLDLRKGHGEGVLSLTSSAKKVPLRVEDLRASVEGFSASVEGLPRSVSLRPGETRRLRVRFTCPPLEGMRIGQKRVVKEGRVGLSGTVTSPWSGVLVRDLGVFFRPRLRSRPQDVRAKGVVGLGVLTASLLAMASVGTAVLAWLGWRASKPDLTGTLRASVSGSGGDPVSVRLSGKRMAIGKGSRLDLPGTGSVRGMRVKGPHGKGAMVGLQVRYRPPGGREVEGELLPDRTLVLDRVTFVHRR